MGGGGGAGEQLQEIERRALAGQQCARRPRELEQQLTGRDGIALGYLPLELRRADRPARKLAST